MTKRIRDRISISLFLISVRDSAYTRERPSVVAVLAYNGDIGAIAGERGDHL
jgi:hypothetical protein